jgi:ubiquinone/menaquinone biosynthesis C-methylase UbiE
MKYDLIHRDKDIITGNDDLITLYTYKKFPVFMGCVTHDISEDLFEDMRWQISKSSGMIQLNPLLPLDVVYPIGHGAGTTGNLWNKHHEEFAKFISTYHPTDVLEIGGGHGILAKKYCKDNKISSWTIIDPNSLVQKDNPARVIKKFFDKDFVADQNYDLLIHSHVLEHIYDVNEFLQHISSFIDNGDLMIFSIPNMKVMMQNNYTNCINFEHTIFLTEPYIEYLLSKYNFEIERKEYFMSDHSIFYCVKKIECTSIKSLPEDLYGINKKQFTDYINFYARKVQELNNSIETVTGPIYLFGAHIFSQYLIINGLDATKIISILDNDVNKQDKRLYGTNLNIQTPKNAKCIDGATIILMMGTYNKEIKTDICQNITKNITFLE